MNTLHRLTQIVPPKSFKRAGSRHNEKCIGGKRYRLAQITVITLALILGLGFCAIGMAVDAAKTAKAPAATKTPAAVLATPAVPEAQENNIQVLTQRLSGEVAGASSNFISVIYETNGDIASEMAMTVDKDVKVINKASMKDIRIRDKVSVVYEETRETIKNKETNTDEVRMRGRVAKIITVNQAAPEPNPNAQAPLTSQ